MYSTCVFCNASLGRNAAIEHFPVGRRLAFDAAKGRLWVVCRRCERWNLTPLEERWEAIEECERMFRETRLRVSTDNIGLAKLREGTELVRIGAPQRPEFAAWRYGDQFGRRRRRHLLVAGAVIAGGGLAIGGAAVAGIGVFASLNLLQTAFRLAVHGRPNATVARIPDDTGHVLEVTRRHLRSTTLTVGDDGAPAIVLTHRRGRTLITGDDARRAAGPLLAAANRDGGTKSDVDQAVGRIARAGSAERFYRSLGAHAAKLTRVSTSEEVRAFADPSDAQLSGLMALPTSLRLAAEMAVHEETERRALEGDLAELEAAWRQADEIAGIADDLLLPSDVAEQLEQARRRRHAP